MAWNGIGSIGNETEEERNLRLQKGVERTRLSRTMETPKQREDRLERTAERNRVAMANETAQQRAIRLERKKIWSKEAYQKKKKNRKVELENAKVQRDRLHKPPRLRSTELKRNNEASIVEDRHDESKHRKKSTPRSTSNGQSQLNTYKRVPCPICSNLYREKYLRIHLLNHAPKNSLPFKCDLCPRAYIRFSTLKSHRQRAHCGVSGALEFSRFCCEVCSALIQSKKNFILHLKYHKRMGDILEEELNGKQIYFYQCDFDGCHLSFRNNYQLNQHISLHRDINNCLVCQECSRCFTMERNYIIHRDHAHKVHSDEVDCPYCWEIVRSEDLDIHKKKHMLTFDEADVSLQGFLCDECGRTFSASELLQAHVKISHVDEHMRQNIIAKQKRRHLACQICDYKTDTLKGIYNHCLQVHTYEHGLFCHICDRRFIALHKLNTHLQRHAGIPITTSRHPCDYCTKVFGSHIMRNKHHFYAHPDRYFIERPVHCIVCYKNFATEEEMEVHLDGHRKWQCSLCSKHSMSKMSFELHMKSHAVQGGSKVSMDKSKRSDESLKKLVQVGDPIDIAQKSIGRVHIKSRFSHQKSTACEIASSPTDTPEACYVKILEPQRPYKCDKCPYQYIDSKKLFLHLKWHEADAAGDLERISSVKNSSHVIFPEQSVMEKYRNPDYVLNKVPPITLRCDKCDAGFAVFEDLTRHCQASHRVKPLEIEAEEGFPFKCSLCPKQFILASNLKIHMESSHSGTTKNERAKTRRRKRKSGVRKTIVKTTKQISKIGYSQEVFGCHLCPRKFRRDRYLNAHLQRHAMDCENGNVEERIKLSYEKRSIVLRKLSDDIDSSSKSEFIEDDACDDDSLHVDSTLATRTDKEVSQSFQIQKSKKLDYHVAFMTIISEMPKKKNEAQYDRRNEELHDQESSTLTSIPLNSNHSFTKHSNLKLPEEGPVYSFYKTNFRSKEEVRKRALKSISRISGNAKRKAEALPFVYVQLKRLNLSTTPHNTKVNSIAFSSNRARETSKNNFTGKDDTKLKQIPVHTSSKANPIDARKKLSKRLFQKQKLEVPKTEEEIDPSEHSNDDVARATDSQEAGSDLSGKKSRKTKVKAKNLSQLMKFEVDDDDKCNESVDTTKLICQVCGKLYKKSSLLEHMKMIHGGPGGEHQCMECNLSFKTANGLLFHCRRKHTKGLITCTLCNMKLRPVPFRAHMEKHKGNPTPYECVDCDAKFKRLISFDYHRRVIHGVLESGGMETNPNGGPKKERSDIDTSSRYFCDICNSFLSQSGKRRYNRHLRQHIHPKNELTETQIIWTYLCDFKDCEAMYRLKDLFISHLGSHGEASGPLICLTCKKVFAQRLNLEKHIQNIHNSEKEVFDCPYCLRWFKDLNTLQVHEMKHKVDLSSSLRGLHICEKCGKDFESIPSMNAHILNVHGPTSSLDTRAQPRKRRRQNYGLDDLGLTCSICQTSFKSDGELMSHLLQKHTYQHGLDCYACRMHFDHHANLMRHLVAEHNHKLPRGLFVANLRRRKSLGTNKKKLVCKYCGIEMCKTELLSKHYLTSHGEMYLAVNSWYCDICFKAFPVESELQVHKVKVHDACKCGICNKQFSRKVYFNIHMMKHKGERPLKCSFCDKTFISIYNLRDHEKRHQNDFNVFCSICPKKSVGFYRNVHLLHHMEKVHGKTKTKANSNEKSSRKLKECNQTTLTRRSMKSHPKCCSAPRLFEYHVDMEEEDLTKTPSPIVEVPLTLEIDHNTPLLPYSANNATATASAHNLLLHNYSRIPQGHSAANFDQFF